MKKILEYIIISLFVLALLFVINEQNKTYEEPAARVKRYQQEYLKIERVFS